MRLRNLLPSALVLFAALNAQAADVILKPFVLASKGAGTVAEKTEQTRTALTAPASVSSGAIRPTPMPRF
jgi:hypothetical protein